MTNELAALLEFWFGRPGDAIWGTMRQAWWAKDETFDGACRDCAEALWHRGMASELDGEAATPEGALALVILFDQMPRNMFRGTPAMYASDERALGFARAIEAGGWQRHYTPMQQLFAQMPFQHSERLPDQERYLAFLRDRYTGPERDQALEMGKRHLEIVARFGRFPHRNAVLGRATTAEEEAFLKEPDSSF